MKRCLYILLFITFFQADLKAEEKNFEKTITGYSLGSSYIYGGNIANAKDHAIDIAKKNILNNLLLKKLNKEQLDKNFKFLSNMANENLDLFIQKYKILSDLEYNGYYNVFIEADILLGNLEKYLNEQKITTGERKISKVLLLLTQKNLFGKTTAWWSTLDILDIGVFEENFSNALDENEFFIINHEAFKKRKMMLLNPQEQQKNTNEFESKFSYLFEDTKTNKDAQQEKKHTSNITNLFLDENLSLPASTLDLKKSSKLANIMGADILIIGNADVSLAKNDMGHLKSFKATSKIDVYKLDVNMKLFSQEYRLSVLDNKIETGTNKALSQLGKMIAKDFSTKVSSILQRGKNKRTTIDLSVSGVDYLKNLVKFREKIQSIKGINKIDTKEVSGNYAILSVDFQGNGQIFAEALLLQEFNDFGISIKDAQDEKVEVIIKKNR